MPGTPRVPMTPAPPEPRVSDELIESLLLGRPSTLGETRRLATDLRDARATIASQAAELAAMTTERDKAVAMVTASSEVAAEHHRTRKAAEAALKAAREAHFNEAARIASTWCLVPPDGGSPSEEEADLCDTLAAHFRSLALTKEP